MKILILVLSLFAFSSYASECPDLAGTYSCVFSDQTFSPLKIEQVSSPNSDIVTYKMTYTRFNYGTDEFQASPAGISDGEGWITKCSKNSLLSVTYDGVMMSQLSLNPEKAFIRRLNGNIVQTCPLIRY